MAKKFKKTLWVLVMSVILAFALWLGNGFFGNPVSALLARVGLNWYVAQTYSHLDLEMERLGYDFKTGGYYAYLVSPGSRDTAFYISLDMLGRVRYDSFDTWVTNRLNIEQRVQEQYRILTDAVLEDPAFVYSSDIRSGMLEFQQDREAEDDRDYSFAIARDELVMDKTYTTEEILAFGKRAGILTVYVQEDTVTAERAAAIMLRIRQMFDEAKVTFYRMDFVLQHPIPEDGADWNREEIRAEILYADLVEPGLEERIRDSHEKIMAWFAKQEK